MIATDEKHTTDNLHTNDNLRKPGSRQMTDDQINARLSKIAGVSADYVKEWPALLQLVEHLGFTVTGKKEESGVWRAQVSMSGLSMCCVGASLNHAACDALIKIHELLAKSQRMIDRGDLMFSGVNAPFSVALIWIGEGRGVARSDWGSKRHVKMLAGTTSPALVGINLHGVPPAFFESSGRSDMTIMPRILHYDFERQSVNDWTPTATDLLANDWMVV